MSYLSNLLLIAVRIFLYQVHMILSLAFKLQAKLIPFLTYYLVFALILVIST